MQDPTEICRLTPADVSRARELIALFGEAFEDAETYAAEPPAIALYEKLGVREEVLHFDIPVGRG